jgi:hypothetical protein
MSRHPLNSAQALRLLLSLPPYDPSLAEEYRRALLREGLEDGALHCAPGLYFRPPAVTAVVFVPPLSKYRQMRRLGKRRECTGEVRTALMGRPMRRDNEARVLAAIAYVLDRGSACHDTLRVYCATIKVNKRWKRPCADRTSAEILAYHSFPPRCTDRSGVRVGLGPWVEEVRATRQLVEEIRRDAAHILGEYTVGHDPGGRGLEPGYVWAPYMPYIPLQVTPLALASGRGGATTASLDFFRERIARLEPEGVHMPASEHPPLRRVLIPELDNPAALQIPAQPITQPRNEPFARMTPGDIHDVVGVIADMIVACRKGDRNE